MHVFYEKTIQLLAAHRKAVLCFMLLATIACALMIPSVRINTDMTSYLPADSAMKQGLDKMFADFPGMSMGGTVRVMTTGLTDAQHSELTQQLRDMEEVTMAAYDADSENYVRGEHRLTELTVLFGTDSEEMASLTRKLEALAGQYPLVYQTGADSLGSVPASVLILAVIMLFGILFLMCHSWIEPVLFLIAIGCAVAINTGTNALLPSVSHVTNCIAAILQLVLSMDYSIILTNRYREERKTAADPVDAMKHAVAASVPAIASSSFTTVVGLLALCFMKFTIGADIGIVLAKGVFCSMVCILTILPALIVYCDGLIRRTEKKVIPLPTGRLAVFSWKSRKAAGAALAVLFAVTFFMKDGAAISYTLFAPNPIDDVFGKSNPIVMLYRNEDEDRMPELLAEFEKDPYIKNISCYASTLGKAMSPEELTAYIDRLGYGSELGQYSSLLTMLFEKDESGNAIPLTISEMFRKAENMLKNPLIAMLAPAGTAEQMDAAAQMLEDAKGQLVGPNYAIAMFDTSYPPESGDTNRFLDALSAYTGEHFSQQVYLIGNSPMQYETSATFRQELNKISLITAAAIFLVVLVTFGNVFVPAVLVLLIQTAVYLTLLFMGWIGSAVYYLALLIVQGILMGATIDYAILYTSLYLEARCTMSVREAVADSLEKSIHTIMTSGLIIVLITWIVGYAFSDPSITQICHIITVGSLMALTLILFILPGADAAFDKWICSRKKLTK